MNISEPVPQENSNGPTPSQELNGSQYQKPPRAHIVLRIGVTGHRTEPEKLPGNVKRKRPVPDILAIRSTIRQVLEVIRNSFKGVAETKGDIFDLTPGRYSQPGGGTLRIISALASGSDQWVASEATKLGYELQSVLPFGRKEYLKDFTEKADADMYLELLDKATAVLELDGIVNVDDKGNRKPDSQSYEAVGRGVLNQSDILIAVWDGQDSHGRGGTGQMVREALQNGIPVVWIPWDNPGKWQLHTTYSWRVLEDVADLSSDSDRLSKLIEKLLLPPEEKPLHNGDSGQSLRTEYFKEKQKKGNPHIGMWFLFRTLICGEIFKKGKLNDVIKAFRVENFIQQEINKSENFWNSKSENKKMNFPIDNELRDWINNHYSIHYAWANGLSMFYGDMHRSAFLLNYLMGALAVFLALVCIATGITGRAQTGSIVAELIVILGILALTFRGRKRQWHQRWIDFRTLAEYIRISRCLILFGGGNLRVVYDAHLSSYGNPTSTWMNWHYRAIVRAAGLPNIVINSVYLKTCQEIWRDSLVGGQIKYHKSTYDRFEKMSTRLHKAGDLLFIATLAACLIHLAHLWMEGDPKFDWIHENLSGWMTLLCAFMPALGAAFVAIRSQGEVQRLAQRSKAMEDNLTKLQIEMAKVPDSGEMLNSVKLRFHADRVSDLMTNEMLDWRVVFQDRPLGLPS